MRATGKEKQVMLGTIVSNMKDVIVLVIMFSFTIFVHELGHFLVALKCGMVVDTFSIGFGPPMWKRKIKGIIYKIGWIPFGGYVALPQLDPSGMAAVQGGEDADKDGSTTERVLPGVAPWKKILVSVAGAVGNIILAIVLAWFIFLNPHAETGAVSSDVGFVATNSAAYASGLRAGDRVLAVNGKAVNTWYKLMEECILQADRKNGNEVTLTVERETNTLETVVPVDVELQTDSAIEGIGKAVGCLFGQVAPDSAVGAAGIKAGDRLVAAFGRRVVSLSHFLAMSKGQDGQTVEISVERGDPGTATRFDATLVLPVEGLDIDLPATVGGVDKGGVADLAGIRRNDVVRDFNGIPIVCWDQFVRLIREGGGVESSISLQRGAGQYTTTVTPRLDEEHGIYRIGIRLGIKSQPPWMRFRRPWRQLSADASGIKRILGGLFNKREARNVTRALGGPVAIFGMLWVYIKTNLLAAVGFLRFLNVNLAILNLLPIPVLDGGHIVFSTWELVSRRKAHPKLVNGLINVFAILLIIVFVLLTVKDIGRLFPPLRRLLPGGGEQQTEAVTNTPSEGAVETVAE